MTAISNPTIIVNNSPVLIMPNSVSYTEGFGEYQKRVVAAGATRRTVFSEDVSTAKSNIKFNLPATNDALEIVRSWKVAKDNNVIQIIDNDTGFSRNFPKAALLTDVENNLTFDGELELEWESDPSV